jgi:hypothetical protein
MPLILTKAPGQKPCLAIESLAMAGGGSAKIRPVRRRPWPGKGWEGGRPHLRLDCDRSWCCSGTGDVARKSRAASAAAA